MGCDCCSCHAELEPNPDPFCRRHGGPHIRQCDVHRCAGIRTTRLTHLPVSVQKRLAGKEHTTPTEAPTRAKRLHVNPRTRREA